MYKLNWEGITCEERVPKLDKDETKYHNNIEKDYVRIIRSASFRRLQDKTQVFPLDQSDFIRTRLTHSIEVSSIGRMIVRQVCDLLKKQIKEGNLPQESLPDPLTVSEILNCAGLLHDLGNPPFGHFGETAIRNWFQNNLEHKLYKGKALSTYLSEAQRYDLYYYEGNAQALRIVLKLHHLTGDYGMRLTSAVMDTIIKYPCDSLMKQKEDEKLKQERSLLRKKIGYFQSEAAQVKQIKRNTGCIKCRNPLAFILEAADDIAYTFSDLEDGYNKGLYTYEQLYEVVQASGDDKGLKALTECKVNAVKHQDNREKDYNPDKQAVFSWLSRKQLYCVTCCARAFVDHYRELMNGVFEQELSAVSSEAKIMKALKAFAFEHIYQNGAILKLELMSNEILTFLMDRFMDALIVYDSEEPMNEIQRKYIELLSKNYVDNYLRSARGKSDGEKLYDRLLLGCDFIAGMTDSYAKRLYQELRGI